VSRGTVQRSERLIAARIGFIERPRTFEKCFQAEGASRIYEIMSLAA